MMNKHKIRWTSLIGGLLMSILPSSLMAQDCSEANNNVLCVDSPVNSTTEENSPFNHGCMNVAQSSFFTFQTNSVASSNSMTIQISNNECSDFLGMDSLYVMVVQIPDGADPCDVSQYSNALCRADSVANFSIQINNPPNNQNYVLIIGTNHDAAYGPCPFTVSLSGDALNLVAGVNPLRINLGDSAQLTVDGQNNGSTVHWTPAEFVNDSISTTPIAFPETTTTFSVTGQVGNCEVTDLITVTVAPPLEIYNAFTPNGDGINDTWKIGRIEKFPNCQVQVYDRWGQLIFKSIGYPKPWDGTNNGKSLPMAAYYYVIELNSLDVKIAPITGIISIIH